MRLEDAGILSSCEIQNWNVIINVPSVCVLRCACVEACECHDGANSFDFQLNGLLLSW